VGEGTFQVGGITIHTQYLNHTSPCLGYRLEAGGVSVVYATDHEPFWWEKPEAALSERLLHPGDHRHLEWLAGADLVIHDGQFTDAEYPAKRNWGHSSIEYATDLAILAGVKRLALFHHDPTRTDQMVARLAQHMLRRARKHGSNLDVIAAAEGQDIELLETASTWPRTATCTRPVITYGRSVMLAGGDKEELVAVRRALEPDGYSFVTAEALDSLGHELAQERPDLLILAPRLDEDSPVGLAQRLRTGCPVGDLPIIIPAREVGSHAAGLLSLGTDIILRPWSAPMLRARLRAWLGRATLLQPARPVQTSGRSLSTGQQLPALFRGLPARARALFLDSARPVHLMPGEILVHENQAASGVYLFRTGTASISISGADGRQIYLGTAGPGEAIGEMAALGGGHHSATVVALNPVVADYIPQDAFFAILGASPEAMLRLLRLLAARLRASDKRIVELVSTKLYNGVIQLLLEGSGNAAGPTGLDIISLAYRVRTSSDQLHRVVMLLEAHSLVRNGPKGVEVLDPQGLRRLIGQDDA
jgi:CRP-like cAMP-binding protein/CheY-like chemotaxis protein